MENKSIKQNVTCKKCGKIHNIDCYPIINFQSSTQDFIKSVFSLELFKFKCECGAETIVQYDTVIVDMYKKYVVYLYINGTDEEFQNDVKPALAKMFSENEEYKQAYSDLKNTRMVRSLNDLLEKLLIYDYDLDDRIVEVIKISLLNSEKIKNDKITTMFFDKIDETNLIFTCLSDDETVQPKAIAIDISVYNKIIDDLKINEVVDDPFTVVNAVYAVNLLSKMNLIENNNKENKEEIIEEATTEIDDSKQSSEK